MVVRRSAMAIYTRRVQAVLSDEQYAALTDLSDDTGKPVSALVREAVEQVYFTEAARARRQAALRTILSLAAPAPDWEQMEAEITRGAMGGASHSAKSGSVA